MNESHDSRPEAEMTELLHRHLLNASTPEEAKELERELLQSPKLRAQYLRATRMDAALYEEFSRRQMPAASPVVVLPWRSMLVAAAAVLLVAFIWRGLIAPSPTSPAAQIEVATLVDARDCRWKGEKIFQEDERLTHEVMHLQSGVALIEFDAGARLALTGPASLEIKDRNSARLLHGAASVRCEDGAEGFILLTPTSTVIDLGTEFGVAVSPDGATAVEVLDGVVEVAGALPPSNATTRVLGAGEAIKLNADGSDRMATARSEGWVRDYTTKAERELRAMPPRLLASDAFASGGLKDVTAYTGGLGWNGTWVRTPQNRRPRLTMAPSAPITKRIGEVGDSVVLAGRQEMRRTLAEAIDPTRRQSVYIGFSFHRIEPVRGAPATTRGGVTVILRASSMWGSFIGGGLNGRNRWASVDSSGVEVSEIQATSGGPHYAIVRIDFRPKMGNRVAIWSHPPGTPVPLQETKQWDLITRRWMGAKKVPMDVIAVRSLDPHGFKIGEIHVGNSWAAVTEPSAALMPRAEP